MQYCFQTLKCDTARQYPARVAPTIGRTLTAAGETAEERSNEDPNGQRGRVGHTLTLYTARTDRPGTR